MSHGLLSSVRSLMRDFVCFLYAISNSRPLLYVHERVTEDRKKKQRQPFLILLMVVSFIGRINALFTNYQLKAQSSAAHLMNVSADTQAN